MKPFRDSLVHPSPFETPEQFGGHDKLRLVYRVDVDTMFMATAMVIDFIDRLQMHLSSDKDSEVPWLGKLRLALEEHGTQTPPEWLHRT